MPDPGVLWRDIQKLDDLYEELLWDPDDELQFSIEYLKGNGRVVITNKTQEENNERKKQNVLMVGPLMIGVIAAMGSYAATGQLIPGVW